MRHHGITPALAHNPRAPTKPPTKGLHIYHVPLASKHARITTPPRTTVEVSRPARTTRPRRCRPGDRFPAPQLHDHDLSCWKGSNLCSLPVKASVLGQMMR